MAALRQAATLGALVALATLLGGCGGTGGDGPSDPGGNLSPRDAPAAGDVEAPDVFQVTEEGLWDGRPSLGGVWVAHPDVTDPERVVVRNDANGRSVVGALFRRERDNPGPALQVSSDAAEALGLLAGAPTTLSVTALRRTEEPAAPEPAPGDAPAAPADGEAVVFNDVGGGAAPAPAAVETTALDAAPEPASTPAATPPEAAQAVAPGLDLAPSPDVDPAAVEAVVAATAAILASAALPADQAPAVPAAPAGPAPDQPFLQLGTFSVEANAQDAARRMTDAGLPARVDGGDGAWRVLVGPASSAAQRDAWLAQARAAGFADAFPVRG